METICGGSTMLEWDIKRTVDELAEDGADYPIVPLADVRPGAVLSTSDLPPHPSFLLPIVSPHRLEGCRTADASAKVVLEFCANVAKKYRMTCNQSNINSCFCALASIASFTGIESTVRSAHWTLGASLPEVAILSKELRESLASIIPVLEIHKFTWKSVLSGAVLPPPLFSIPHELSVPPEAALWSSKFAFHFLARWYWCPVALTHSDPLSDQSNISDIVSLLAECIEVEITLEEDWESNDRGLFIGIARSSFFFICNDRERQFPLGNWCIVSAEHGIAPVTGAASTIELGCHALAQMANSGIMHVSSFNHFRRMFKISAQENPERFQLFRARLGAGAVFQ